MKLVQEMISPAFTIAILAGIESLLSAVVSDGMIGDTHKSNAELIGQGLGNIFSGLFGGIPATGAIARTAANVRNGGRTPIAGIVHCITLTIILLLFLLVRSMVLEYIHQFGFVYEPITMDNMMECLNFGERWCDEHRYCRIG